MFRSLIGFAIFAVIAVFLFKIFLGIRTGNYKAKVDISV